MIGEPQQRRTGNRAERRTAGGAEMPLGAGIATGPVTLATGTRGERALTADAATPRRRIVVLGAGRVGRIVVRAVRTRGFACLVVDRDQRALEEVVKLGAETLFGDAAKAIRNETSR